MKIIKLRCQELSFAVIFVIIILIGGFFYKETSLQECVKLKRATSNCVSPECHADHFPFFIRSGVTNVIGPKICFNNSIVMSGGQNNVGRGLNIVVVDGETGRILKCDFFKIHSEELLDFLQTIQKGNLILVASYEDSAVQLTDEVRELFAGMGSSMVYSVKSRDSWVFAGAVGLNKESPFEKLIVNDNKTNAYGDWPEMGELGGCFPRKVLISTE